MTRAGAFAFALALLAQSLSALAQPIRPLGAIVSRTSTPMMSVTTARRLADGRVLVNDILARRLLIFDANLARAVVLLDSTAGSARSYGPRPGGLIAYRGDSSAFVDADALALLIIDPLGRIVRVASAPRPADVPTLFGGQWGSAGFDLAGRMVSRTLARAPRTSARGAGTPPTLESTPLLRLDPARKHLDTLATLASSRPSTVVSRTESGALTIVTTIHPLPTVDDWALLPDGSIGIVRGGDFHVDWVSPDGSQSASKRMPFEWERLTSDAKQRLLDSLQDVSGRARTANTSLVTLTSAPETRLPTPRIEPVSAHDLPDYRPAFVAGASRSDDEGNLWVRTTRVRDGRPLYYVISRTGGLIDRVELPPGRVLVGFAGPGEVYLAVRDVNRDSRLERARVR